MSNILDNVSSNNIFVEFDLNSIFLTIMYLDSVVRSLLHNQGMKSFQFSIDHILR